MFIPRPGSCLWIFPHPGSRIRIQGSKSTGSRIRIRSIGYRWRKCKSIKVLFVHFLLLDSDLDPVGEPKQRGFRSETRFFLFIISRAIFSRGPLRLSRLGMTDF
jgi:hypothetical protein